MHLKGLRGKKKKKKGNRKKMENRKKEKKENAVNKKRKYIEKIQPNGWCHAKLYHSYL